MTAPPDRIFAYVAHDGRLLGITDAKANPNIDWPAYVRADLLSDPDAVHLNMLRGTIAKPSLAQIAHIYGDEWTAAIAAAEARGREQVMQALEKRRSELFESGRLRNANTLREAIALIPAPKEKPDE